MRTNLQQWDNWLLYTTFSCLHNLGQVIADGALFCSFWMVFLIKSIYMVLYAFVVSRGAFIPLCKIRM